MIHAQDCGSLSDKAYIDALELTRLLTSDGVIDA
jgi:hypothetical protein